jgi:hypothetical protein
MDTTMSMARRWLISQYPRKTGTDYSAYNKKVIRHRIWKILVKECGIFAGVAFQPRTRVLLEVQATCNAKLYIQRMSN